MKCYLQTVDRGMRAVNLIFCMQLLYTNNKHEFHNGSAHRLIAEASVFRVRCVRNNTNLLWPEGNLHYILKAIVICFSFGCCLLLTLRVNLHYLSLPNLSLAAEKVKHCLILLQLPAAGISLNSFYPITRALWKQTRTNRKYIF